MRDFALKPGDRCTRPAGRVRIETTMTQNRPIYKLGEVGDVVNGVKVVKVVEYPTAHIITNLEAAQMTPAQLGKMFAQVQRARAVAIRDEAKKGRKGSLRVGYLHAYPTYKDAILQMNRVIHGIDSTADDDDTEWAEWCPYANRDWVKDYVQVVMYRTAPPTLHDIPMFALETWRRNTTRPDNYPCLVGAMLFETGLAGGLPDDSPWWYWVRRAEIDHVQFALQFAAQLVLENVAPPDYKQSHLAYLFYALDTYGVTVPDEELTDIGRYWNGEPWLPAAPAQEEARV